MTTWMPRGLVFAAAMIVVRLFQGALINTFPPRAGLISLVLMILFVIFVVVWGLIDGRADARANPDPDRRRDLAMIWLLAGLVAGVVSGVVTWLISLFYKGLYVGGLINEVTTFAAFTALLVFLPGMVGVVVGRWLIDRKAPEVPHHGGDEDRVDTDVFAAVRADETGEVAGGHPEHRAQRVPPAYSEEPTQEAPTQFDAERTQRARRPEDDQR